MLQKPKDKISYKREISRLMRRLIIGLYNNGYSVRQIENFVALPHYTIYKRIIKGRARDKQEAATLRQSPKAPTKARTARLQARNKAQEVFNRGIPLPAHLHVHHKDEDPFNNDIDNLQILNNSEHIKLHKPKNPVPRHLQPERKRYMKKYLQEYRRRY